MTMVSRFHEGHLINVVREDAVRRPDRHYSVPTSDQTKWVSTWQEAREIGMEVCFNEDQTEIELRLPAPYKFSIQFQR